MKKKTKKTNETELVWLGSEQTCVVLVNTLRLQLFCKHGSG